MTSETEDLLKRLGDAEWFAKVSQLLPDDFRASVVAVSSWEEAVACCSSVEWDRVEAVIDILQQVTHLLRLPDTDVAWSRYNSVAEAVDDINRHMARLRSGDLTGMEDLRLLFAPTGSLQEISINSGWGEELLHLAARFDQAIEPQRAR